MTFSVFQFLVWLVSNTRELCDWKATGQIVNNKFILYILSLVPILSSAWQRNIQKTIKTSIRHLAWISIFTI